MTSPKLSVASSGLGGRGYRAIFEEDAQVVPSITTALGALDKPGLVDWHVSQTAAFAVTHVDDLLSRTEEAGMRYLQYFSRRKPKDWDAPEIDVYNAAQYVLDDAANTGNYIHNYIEDYLTGNFTTEPVREDHAEMVEAFHAWEAEHDIEVIATERTVFGQNYAGTADLFAKIDGVVYCVDHKSSRAVRDSHIGQLGAIGAAHTAAREVSEGTEGAVYHKIQPKVSAEHGGQVDSWWVPEALPDFQAYGVLQVRPLDYTTKGEVIEPFCALHTIPQAKIEAGFKLFQAGLSARLAQRELNQLEKEAEES